MGFWKTPRAEEESGRTRVGWKVSGGGEGGRYKKEQQIGGGWGSQSRTGTAEGSRAGRRGRRVSWGGRGMRRAMVGVLVLGRRGWGSALW